MVTKTILTRKNPSRSTLPPPELEDVDVCQPSRLPGMQENAPPSVVITLNIQAAKPSPLLNASALLIALAAVIAAISPIAEKVIDATVASWADADPEPLVIESEPECDRENAACIFDRSRTKPQEFI